MLLVGKFLIPLSPFLSHTRVCTHSPLTQPGPRSHAWSVFPPWSPSHFSGSSPGPEKCLGLSRLHSWWLWSEDVGTVLLQWSMRILKNKVVPRGCLSEIEWHYQYYLNQVGGLETQFMFRFHWNLGQPQTIFGKKKKSHLSQGTQRTFLQVTSGTSRL